MQELATCGDLRCACGCLTAAGGLLLFTELPALTCRNSLLQLFRSQVSPPVLISASFFVPQHSKDKPALLAEGPERWAPATLPARAAWVCKPAAFKWMLQLEPCLRPTEDQQSLQPAVLCGLPQVLHKGARLYSLLLLLAKRRLSPSQRARKSMLGCECMTDLASHTDV